MIVVKHSEPEKMSAKFELFCAAETGVSSDFWKITWDVLGVGLVVGLGLGTVFIQKRLKPLNWDTATAFFLIFLVLEAGSF